MIADRVTDPGQDHGATPGPSRTAGQRHDQTRLRGIEVRIPNAPVLAIGCENCAQSGSAPVRYGSAPQLATDPHVELELGSQPSEEDLDAWVAAISADPCVRAEIREL